MHVILQDITISRMFQGNRLSPTIQLGCHLEYVLTTVTIATLWVLIVLNNTVLSGNWNNTVNDNTVNRVKIRNRKTKFSYSWNRKFNEFVN